MWSLPAINKYKSIATQTKSQNYLQLIANNSGFLFEEDFISSMSLGIYRYRRIVSTNKWPLSSWGTVLNSTATAEAILDRLVYHSHVIKIKGKSYRLASVSS